MIEMAAKLIKVLNSDSEPGQISLAFCLAMIIGLTPLYSLHNLIVIFLALVLKVNLSAFILGWIFFSGMAFLLDPLFDIIGFAVLTAPVLENLWRSLYNIALFKLSYFYNSIVMGSLVFSLVLFVPLFFISNLAIRRYRSHVLKWIEKSKLMQVIKASKFYHAYQAVSGWRS